MKIDLLSVSESNKEIKLQENELEFKKELRKLICAIVEGEETFYTSNENLLKTLGVKYSKHIKGETGFLIYAIRDSFEAKLNNTNIKKIQKYLNKEN